MTDLAGYSLTTVTGAALSDGVKFLYAQATELLRRRRSSSQAAQSAETRIRDVPHALDGPLQPVTPDKDALNAYAEQLTALRHAIVDYVEGLLPISAEDHELISNINNLRNLLEIILRQYLTFQGENRRTTGTPIAGHDLIQRKTISASAAISTGYGSVAIGRDNQGTIQTHGNIPRNDSSSND